MTGNRRLSYVLANLMIIPNGILGAISFSLATELGVIQALGFGFIFSVNTWVCYLYSASEDRP